MAGLNQGGDPLTSFGRYAHARSETVSRLWMKAKLPSDRVVIIALTRIGQKNVDHTLDYASHRDEPIDWGH